MRMRINIKKLGDGYVCIATNGDLPFEGRKHESVADAINDLRMAYGGNTWKPKFTPRGCSIKID